MGRRRGEREETTNRRGVGRGGVGRRRGEREETTNRGWAGGGKGS